MKLATKLALAAGASAAVVAWSVVAYVAGDDERRDFVTGSTTRSGLPRDVLIVDTEVDDDYEDTDEETDPLPAAPLTRQIAVFERLVDVTAASKSKAPAVQRLTPTSGQEEKARAKMDEPESIEEEQPERAADTPQSTNWLDQVESSDSVGNYASAIAVR